jgi:hypothetical protein
MSNPFIYLRILRNVDHTVFVVDGGQKTYYHPQFNKKMPFSSGQQVKRSIIESMTDQLGREMLSPLTFFHEFSETGSKKTAQKEIWGACDPSYANELIGGWMKAGGDEKVLKRRSPLSISAMRPLHPLLGGTTDEAGTFDLRGRQNTNIVVKMGNKVMTQEEIDAFLGKVGQQNYNFMNKRIDSSSRATGLFVVDVAIDLRTLFAVSLDPFEPEISKETELKLREAGWKEGKNDFGKCLICPEERRSTISKALCNALFNWRITTNQSRTFSMEDILAVAISPSAHRVAAAIRAQLRDDVSNAARPIIDEKAGADLFIAPPAEGYIQDVNGSVDALDKADEKLIELLKLFNFDNQQFV